MIWTLIAVGTTKNNNFSGNQPFGIWRRTQNYNIKILWRFSWRQWQELKTSG